MMLVDLIITLHADYIKLMPSILERFKKEGLSVSGFTDYGVVMGKADRTLIQKLSRDKEVESVIEDFYTQLPPPGSDIQ